MIRIINLVFVFFLMIGSISSQPTVIFQGGKGSGNISIALISSTVNVLVNGGNGSGYYLSSLSSVETFYKGGKAQGYALQDLESTNELVNSLGGQGDGYHMEVNYREFIWTGNVGEGWNNADNWNYLMKPDLTRKTIIPAGAANWPHINSGIFAIGSNPDGGAFTTAELWIEKDAQLTTRVNNIVQNYGAITIEGLMTVKNSDSNAFINNVGSTLNIVDSGTLIFDPN